MVADSVLEGRARHKEGQEAEALGGAKAMGEQENAA
jgi:hypothetical protein